MAPAFWYILLGLFGLIIFTITILKVRDRRVFAVYTFIAGLIYCLEYFILVLFKSYEYYPHILNNKYFDNILGSIFSNAIIVPMTAAMIGTLQVNWGWSLLAIGIIISIEKLFLWLEIYQHFWWKIYYTALGLVICFLLAKLWDKKLRSGASFTVRLLTVFMSNLLFQSTFFYVLVAFGNLFLFQSGWFSNPARDHLAIVTAYTLFISVIFTFLVMKKIKWIGKVTVLFLITGLTGIFLYKGLLIMSNNWSLVHFFVLYFLILLILDAFDRWIFSTCNIS